MRIRTEKLSKQVGSCHMQCHYVLLRSCPRVVHISFVHANQLYMCACIVLRALLNHPAWYFGIGQSRCAALLVLCRRIWAGICCNSWLLQGFHPIYSRECHYNCCRLAACVIIWQHGSSIVHASCCSMLCAAICFVKSSRHLR